MADVPGVPKAAKIEDKPLADPHLSKPARIALGVFGLATLGASLWIAWLLWSNVKHPFWPGMAVGGAYGAWVLWPVWRERKKRQREAGTGSGKISRSENSK